MTRKSTISGTRGSFSALATCVTIGLLWLPLVVQSASELPAEIAKRLRTHGIPASDISLYISRVSANSPTLAVNAATPRNPASVMKLLTSLVALDTLGPNFHWQTEAYVRGDLEDGVLKGDLILKGYGDPYLTPERFWRFLHGLRQRGIEEIQGDLIIDSTYFEATRENRGDFDGRPRRAYNALPHPLSLNFQTTKLHLLPNQTGTRIRVFTYPPLDNLEIRNSMELVSGPCQKQHLRPVILISEHNDGATMNIQGSYSPDCPEWSGAYLVMDPADHVAGAFSTLWKEMGGNLEGAIKQGLVPQQARRFHRIESPPLAEVIRSMNKFSNNLMSRMLLLTMVAESHRAPAETAHGQTLITDWLNHWELPSSLVWVSNGSGLSRNARISAEIIGRLLQAAFKSPLMPEFMASLPIVGIDGTMRKRLRTTGVAGRAHIKTGSLNNVSSMAGYVLDQHNQRWVVTLIINHLGLQSWQGKQVQDAVLKWVYQGPKRSSDGAVQVADTSELECEDEGQTQVITKETDGSPLSYLEQPNQAPPASRADW